MEQATNEDAERGAGEEASFAEKEEAKDPVERDQNSEHGEPCYGGEAQ